MVCLEEGLCCVLRIRLFRIITQYDEWTIVIGIRKCLLVWRCSWLYLFGCVQLTVTSLPEYFVFFPPAEPVFPVFRSGFIIVVVFLFLHLFFYLVDKLDWVKRDKKSLQSVCHGTNSLLPRHPSCLFKLTLGSDVVCLLFFSFKASYVPQS